MKKPKAKSFTVSKVYGDSAIIFSHEMGPHAKLTLNEEFANDLLAAIKSKKVRVV